MENEFVSNSPEETFRIAQELGATLAGGEVLLYKGSLGVGKTLFTKGLLDALGFDIDEVNSPSFALVNHYKTKFDVFHIDLWRIEGNADTAFAVGLDEILENPEAIVIIEWAEKIIGFEFGRVTITVEIEGNGDHPRSIKISAEDRLFEQTSG
jgi:tRNA threonylcarbamoyladenosine biosynthesis protein TsaE